jgi:hypothetical protein
MCRQRGAEGIIEILGYSPICASNKKQIGGSTTCGLASGKRQNETAWCQLKMANVKLWKGKEFVVKWPANPRSTPPDHVKRGLGPSVKAQLR